MPPELNAPCTLEADKERIAQLGMDLSMANRCGKFLQMDQDIVHAECSAEGIEVLSYRKAMGKICVAEGLRVERRLEGQGRYHE